jgi:hypothetical protein
MNTTMKWVPPAVHGGCCGTDGAAGPIDAAKPRRTKSGKRLLGLRPVRRNVVMRAASDRLWPRSRLRRGNAHCLRPVRDKAIGHGAGRGKGELTINPWIYHGVIAWRPTNRKPRPYDRPGPAVLGGVGGAGGPAQQNCRSIRPNCPSLCARFVAAQRDAECLQLSTMLELHL